MAPGIRKAKVQLRLPYSFILLMLSYLYSFQADICTIWKLSRTAGLSPWSAVPKCTFRSNIEQFQHLLPPNQSIF